MKNMIGNPLLRMEKITKKFPGVLALSDVDFQIQAGEVVCVVGENGAGKSTLMKILSGAYQKDSGKIFIKDKEVEIENPHHAQELGISIIYQEFNLTQNQSVAANIFIGREPLQSGLGRLFGFIDKKRMEKNSKELLDKVNANLSPKTQVSDLSVAEQQLVEIAKALSVDAQIIIMDEPTAPLGEKEVSALFHTVHALKKQGMGIIFITHRLEEVFKISDRIVVLRDGKCIGELPVADATMEKVVHMMVGRSLHDFLHKAPAKISEPILEVKDLSRKGKIHHISFTLRSGEILGFAGLVGAGRTETVRTLFGADLKDKGEVLIAGRRMELKTPKDAVNAGLSLVPEDRVHQGLVLKLPVMENITLATLKFYSTLGWMNHTRMQKTAEDFIEQLSVRTPHVEQKVMYLSGGNQQKVVLAKWLASKPKVLILDEPTRGIDVGAKSEVYSLMSKLVQTGIGIIMISSELPEVLGMSDRIVVMHEGSIAAILDRSEATQEMIMAYASGQRKD